MSTSSTLVWLFVGLLVAIVILGFLLHRSTKEFPERRLQLQISLFIQLLGSIVFAGIVTYSIYVIEHAQQAEEKRVDDLAIAASNKTRVLRFIKEELNYNLEVIKSRDGNMGNIPAQPLKSDFWRITGLSGDLKWIDDIEMLNSVAQAYFDIGQLEAWETRFLDANLGITSTLSLNLNNGQQMPLKQYIASTMGPRYDKAKLAIEKALGRL